MTSEEFWKDDPNLFLAYHTSFINRKKHEYEEWIYSSWLQGLYIHEGNSILTQNIATTVSRVHGGNAKYSKNKYPSKPLEINKKKNEKEKEKEKRQKEYFDSYNYFATLKQKFVERIKKGE